MQIIKNEQIRVILIVLVLGALFGFGYWMPHRNQVSELNQRIETAQAQIIANNQAAGRLSGLNRDVQVLKASLGRSVKRACREDEVADLFRKFNTDVAAVFLNNLEVTTSTLLTAQEYKILPVKLQFRGSFPSMFGFLKKIETMEQIVRIVNLEVAGDINRRRDDLKVSLDLSVVFAKGRED